MPPPLIAIAGATATGKTALAVALAVRLDGEIINADSRQVYRGMDIGTAKPAPPERERAPHWLTDICDPDETFTLVRFLDLAWEAIADIRARGKRPIVAGGTSQYLFALLEGWQPPRVPPDPALRHQLEETARREGPAALLRRLERIDPSRAAAVDASNPRRIIRAIEVALSGAPADTTVSPGDAGAITLGLRLDREGLHRRIDERVDRMVRDGLVDEVRALNGRGYGCDLPALQSIGYREVCAHLAGRCSLGEATARIKTETHRLARTQETWLRPRASRIRWLDAASGTLAEDAFAAVRATT